MRSQHDLHCSSIWNESLSVIWFLTLFFIFGFQIFNYDMPTWCFFPPFFLAWDLLSFLTFKFVFFLLPIWGISVLLFQHSFLLHLFLSMGFQLHMFLDILISYRLWGQIYFFKSFFVLFLKIGYFLVTYVQVHLTLLSPPICC